MRIETPPPETPAFLGPANLPPSDTPRVMYAALGFLLLLLFVFYAATMTQGIEAVGSDWAMYVMHARNLVTGHPYTDTGYVFQPETALHSASSYPSGYPLLLAPFYSIFGFNLHVFKLLNAVLLVLSLWPAFLFARRTLPVIDSFVLIVLLGLSMPYLTLHNAIGSDAPYLAWSFFLLLLILKVYDRRWNQTSPWIWGPAVGLGIAAAYLIRPIGVAFLVAVVVLELIKYRRPTLFLITTCAAFVPVVLLNNLLFYKDAAYSNQFILSIPRFAAHIVTYTGLLSYVFSNPLSQIVRYLLWASMLPLVLLGFVNHLRKNITIAECYIMAVLGVLVAYHMPNARYLIPVMPIYLAYMFEGFRALLAYLQPSSARVVYAAVTLAWLFPAGANAILIRSFPNDTLITAPLYEDLCNVVRDRTPPRELLVFWNPCVLALSTGRHASPYPHVPPDRLAAYLQRIRPNYIVIDKEFPDDQEYLVPVLKAAPVPPEVIYENRQFRLLRVPDSPDRTAQDQR